MLTWEQLKKAKLGQSFELEDLKNCCMRTCGGIAFPNKRPGFVVVVGMRYDNTLCLFDECESYDTREIVQQSGLLDSKYEPDIWVGDTENACAAEFINEMNKEEGRAGRRFDLSGIDVSLRDMETLYPYILGKLKELRDPKCRRLELKDSNILSYMGSIEQSEVASLERGDYPALEVLIYAVFELLQNQPVYFTQEFTDGGNFISEDDDLEYLSLPGAIDHGLEYDDSY